MTKLRMEWPLSEAQPALVLTRPDFKAVKNVSTNDANCFGRAGEYEVAAYVGVKLLAAA